MLEPAAILAVVTLASNSFAVVTASSASLAVVTFKSVIFTVVTALSASLAVIIPKSFTLKGLAVVPKPSIVVRSAVTDKLVLSIHATTPVASVTKTLLFPPDEIFTGVTAASNNFIVVTASSSIPPVPL